MKPLLIGLVFLFVLSGCGLLKSIREVICPPAVQTDIKVDPQSEIIAKAWWIIPGCLLGLGAAAFLLVMKQVKLAMALAAAFAVTLVLSITIFKHFALIGYIILGIGILLAGYALYKAWLYRDGFSRLFLTGEASKLEMDEVGKTNIYGGTDDHGIAGVLQNKVTERLVLLERKKNGTAKD